MKFGHMSLGDEYATKLANNLPKTAEVQTIQLSNNRLSSRGAIAMFGTVNESSK